MGKVTILDGGMGALLQARGLKPGEAPEDWNVEHADEVTAVHRAYLEAGSQVVYTNTFGANRLKYHGRHTLEEVIHAGVANAKKVKEQGQGQERRTPLVALDIGPTGRLLKPIGDLDFDEAVEAFKETIRIATEVRPSSPDLHPDLIVIETMSDIYELKAAVLAAKEMCSLPIYATVALGTDGKLLTGGSVESVSALMESMGVDAYGFNCGVGPDLMLPAVERLAKISTKPIIAKPNAGLPEVVGGKTVFPVGPQAFGAAVAKLVEAGASIVGGCCGTTPDHILEVASKASRTAKTGRTSRTIVSSGTAVIELKAGEGLIVGERINPTGKKALKEAYAKGDTAYVLREAVKQVDAGAAILDVNCGVPGLDEAALLEATVSAVQGVVTCPLQIDTADPVALERALRRVNGKPLVNSVNGRRESMDAVFPLVRKYGGTIVGLCLDEGGIPPTSEGRLAIARRILAEGAKYGFTKSDFVFDALTLSVSSDPMAAKVTLETVKRLADELGVNTILGVSNVSFGLPNRPALNNAMYALAKRAGLSAAIANPALIGDEIDPAAEDVLMGRDENCARWIEREAQRSEVRGQTAEDTALRLSASADLSAAIRRGLKADARAAAAAEIAAGKTAMEVIQERIVPALEEVGSGFEKGTVYLPQLLMAADAAGEAFAVVRNELAGEKKSQISNLKSQSLTSNQPPTADKQQPTADKQQPTADNQQPTINKQQPIILATVKGDIHDIGKNIVRALLENYGFDVIDLGRDVAPEAIVEAAERNDAMMVGLSALMTTTVGAMAETIRQLKSTGLRCRTVVGGAVVTQEYADEIGADYYAKDAMRTVRIAESLRADYDIISKR